MNFYHDDMLRKSFTNASYVFDEMFRVAVSNIEADESNFRDTIEDLAQLFKISFARTRRGSNETGRFLIL